MHFNKKILSDVDGVILDFNKFFIKFVNKKLHTKHKPKHCIYYNFCSSLGITELQWNRLYGEFLDTEIVKNLEYYSGVVKLFKYFSDNGYEIQLVTDIMPVAKDKRVKNLHKIDFAYMHFDMDRHSLTKRYNPQYIFEDRPEYIFDYIKLSEHFDFLFVPIRPYNRVYIDKWINHEQIFVYDNYKKLLKKFKLLEEIYETEKPS